MTVQNTGCIFVYFCGGCKNNFRLQFRSSVKETFTGSSHLKTSVSKVANIWVYTYYFQHGCASILHKKTH